MRKSFRLSALTSYHHNSTKNPAKQRGRTPAPLQWRGLEALESRVMLDGSPFSFAAFTPLPGPATIVAGPGGLNGQPMMDLNGDGVGDLIVEYHDGNSVSESVQSTVAAMLVHADGTASVYKIGQYNIPGETTFDVVNQTAVADLNNDGHMDVVVLYNLGGVNSTHQFLDVFMGQADGTFTHPNPAIDLGTIQTAPTMTLLDMNGDGKTDIQLQNNSYQSFRGESQFTTFVGNNDGTFANPAKTNISSGLVVSGTFTQDVNGDGIKDLVMSVADQVNTTTFMITNSLSVYLGKATGGFNTTPSFRDTVNNLTFQTFARFSNDSSPDILADSAAFGMPTGPATVTVLINNGHGVFTPTFTSNSLGGGYLTQFLPANFPPLTPDLNNDGVADLILVEGSGLNTTSGIIHVGINNKSGGFTESQAIAIPDLSSVSTVIVADVDGDGFPDLFVTQQNGTIGTYGEVFFNNGHGSFITPGVALPHVVTSAVPPRLADFNGDGKLDVFVAGVGSAGTDTGQVLVNTAGRSFTPGPAADVGSTDLANVTHMQDPADPLLDYTGDGGADVISYGADASNGSLGFALFSSDANGLLTATPLTTTGDDTVPIPFTADFNHDGKIDLIFLSAPFATDGIYIMINGQETPANTSGSTFDTAEDLGTLTAPLSLTDFVDAEVSDDLRNSQNYYKFTLPSTQTVRITATGVGGTVFLNLTTNANQHPTVANSFLSPAVITATLNAGTYFIDAGKGAGANTPFRLDIAFPSAGPQIDVLNGFTTLTSGQDTAIDFGDVLLTTTDTHKVFTVRNDGQTTLNLQAIQLPAGFTLDAADPLVSSLTQENQDTFSVSMDTSVAGNFSGNIVIPSDDPNTPSFSIPVRGSVTAPVVVQQPAHMTVLFGSTAITSGQANPIPFGSVVQGASPVVETFTIRNDGDSNLVAILALPPLQAIPTGFTQTTALTSPLTPGQQASFSVELNTDTVGTFSGSIQILNNSDGANTIFQLPITGTVTTAGGGGGSLPNLQGEIHDIIDNGQSASLSNPIIPGDKITAVVRIFDDGIADVKAASFAVAFFASVDEFLDGGDIPIQTVTASKINITHGSFEDVSFQLVVPQNVPPGSYHFLANLDSNQQIAESDETNNVAIDGTVVPVLLEAGQIGSRNVTLKFTVPNGTLVPTPVTLAMAKGGTATVEIEDDNSLDIQVTGSTASSAFTLTTGKGATVTLNNVTIGGLAPAIQAFDETDFLAPAAAAAAPLLLKSFTATGGVLVGTFEAGGAIQTITIGQVSGGLIKIDQPPVGVNVSPLTITIPVDIQNGSIDSAIPIKAFKTIDWLDTDGTPDFLKAPSIGSITTTGNKKTNSAGDFQTDVAGEDDGDGNPTATTLSSAKIAGSLNGAAWNLAGVLTSLQIAGSAGSAANPLAITAGSIKTLKVTGGLDHAAILLNMNQVVDAKNIALGSLTVSGTVNDSSIVSVGNISSATVGALMGSTVFAGVDTTGNAIGTLPDAASDFTPGSAAAITKLTVTGVKNQPVSFQGSVIAAVNLGTITVVNLPTDGSAAGGVSGETLLKYIRKANNKAVTLNPVSPIDQLNGYVVRTVV